VQAKPSGMGGSSSQNPLKNAVGKPGERLS
jgi:hypothetical protein